MHKKSTCEREGKELKRDFFNKFNLGTSNFVTPGKQLEFRNASQILLRSSA